MRCTEWFAGRSVDEPRVRAPARAAWKIWALAIAVLIVLSLACGGCAAPICPVPTMNTVITDDGTFYVFDQANLALESVRLQRLDAGKCRLGREGGA